MFLTWLSLKEKGKQAENVLRMSFCNADSNRLLVKLRRKERERNVLIQCLFYLTAFYMTWVCPTALRVKQSTSGTPSFGLLLCVGIFLPLQGFFNVLVYLRPRFQQYKKRNRGRRSIISYDGLKSIFIEHAGEEEEDFNVAPSNNDDDIEREKRSSQGSGTPFRFRDSFGGIGRSKRSGIQSSTGSPPQSRNVRFSQIESQIEDPRAVSRTSSTPNIINVGSSRSSVASAEEKREENPIQNSSTENGNTVNGSTRSSGEEEKAEECSPI
jgi:hypothetical protein